MPATKKGTQPGKWEHRATIASYFQAKLSAEPPSQARPGREASSVNFKPQQPLRKMINAVQASAEGPSSTRLAVHQKPSKGEQSQKGLYKRNPMASSRTGAPCMPRSHNSEPNRTTKMPANIRTLEALKSSSSVGGDREPEWRKAHSSKKLKTQNPVSKTPYSRDTIRGNFDSRKGHSSEGSKAIHPGCKMPVSQQVRRTCESAKVGKVGKTEVWKSHKHASGIGEGVGKESSMESKKPEVRDSKVLKSRDMKKDLKSWARSSTSREQQGYSVSQISSSVKSGAISVLIPPDLTRPSIDTVRNKSRSDRVADKKFSQKLPTVSSSKKSPITPPSSPLSRKSPHSSPQLTGRRSPVDSPLLKGRKSSSTSSEPTLSPLVTGPSFPDQDPFPSRHKVNQPSLPQRKRSCEESHKSSPLPPRLSSFFGDNPQLESRPFPGNKSLKHGPSSPLPNKESPPSFHKKSLDKQASPVLGSHSPSFLPLETKSLDERGHLEKKASSSVQLQQSSLSMKNLNETKDTKSNQQFRSELPTSSTPPPTNSSRSARVGSRSPLSLNKCPRKQTITYSGSPTPLTQRIPSPALDRELKNEKFRLQCPEKSTSVCSEKANSKEKVRDGNTKVASSSKGDLPMKREGCEEHHLSRKKKRVFRELSIDITALSPVKELTSGTKRPSFVSLLDSGGLSVSPPSKKACVVDLTRSPRRNGTVNMIDLTLEPDIISLDDDSIVDLCGKRKASDSSSVTPSSVTPPLKDLDLTPELSARSRAATSTPTSSKSASSAPRKSVSVRKTLFRFPSPDGRRSEGTPPLQDDLVTPTLVHEEAGVEGESMDSDRGLLDRGCGIGGGATGGGATGVDVVDVIETVTATDTVPVDEQPLQPSPKGCADNRQSNARVLSPTTADNKQFDPTEDSLHLTTANKWLSADGMAASREQFSSKDSSKWNTELSHCESNELSHCRTTAPSNVRGAAECAIGVTAEDSVQASSKEGPRVENSELKACAIGVTAENSKQTKQLAECALGAHEQFDRTHPWKSTPLEDVSVMRDIRGISCQVSPGEVRLLSPAHESVINNQLELQDRLSSYPYCSALEHLQVVTTPTRMLKAGVLSNLWEMLLKAQDQERMLSLQKGASGLGVLYLRHLLNTHPPGQHPLVDQQYSQFVVALCEKEITFGLWQHLQVLLRSRSYLGTFLVDLLVADFWAALTSKRSDRTPLFLRVFWPPGSSGSHVTRAVRELVEDVAGLVQNWSKSVEKAAHLRNLMDLVFLVGTVCVDLATEILLTCNKFPRKQLLCFTSHIHSTALYRKLLQALPLLRETERFYESLFDPDTGKFSQAVKPVKLVPTAPPPEPRLVPKKKKERSQSDTLGVRSELPPPSCLAGAGGKCRGAKKRLRPSSREETGKPAAKRGRPKRAFSVYCPAPSPTDTKERTTGDISKPARRESVPCESSSKLSFDGGWRHQAASKHGRPHTHRRRGSCTAKLEARGKGASHDVVHQNPPKPPLSAGQQHRDHSFRIPLISSPREKHSSPREKHSSPEEKHSSTRPSTLPPSKVKPPPLSGPPSKVQPPSKHSAVLSPSWCQGTLSPSWRQGALSPSWQMSDHSPSRTKPVFPSRNKLPPSTTLSPPNIKHRPAVVSPSRTKYMPKDPAQQRPATLTPSKSPAHCPAIVSPSKSKHHSSPLISPAKSHMSTVLPSTSTSPASHHKPCSKEAKIKCVSTCTTSPVTPRSHSQHSGQGMASSVASSTE